MPLQLPATTQPGVYHEAFLQYQTATGVVNAIVFDSVLSEDWDEPASVTEHPVENGANVADHVRVGLAKVTLKVRVTNEPLDSNQFTDPIGGAGQLIALPLSVPTPDQTEFDGVVTASTWQTPPPIAAVAINAVAGIATEAVGALAQKVTEVDPGGNALAAKLVSEATVTPDGLWSYPEAPPAGSGIGRQIVSVLGDVAQGLVSEGVTSLIPAGEEVDVPVFTDAGLAGGSGVPIPVTAKTVQFLGERDFAAEMKKLLAGLKNSAQLFTVQGSKQTQANMVIETLQSHRGAPDETGTGMDLTIGLKQVRLVSTSTVPAPLPSIPAAKPPVNKGAQDGAPMDPSKMQSVFKKAIVGGFNLLSGGSPPGVP